LRPEYGNLGHGDTRMVQDLFLCDGGFNKMAHLGGYYGGEIVLVKWLFIYFLGPRSELH